jgi:uncharacterized protein HemY
MGHDNACRYRIAEEVGAPMTLTTVVELVVVVVVVIFAIRFFMKRG